MKSFKSFLTILALVLSICAAAHAAGKDVSPDAKKAAEPVRAIDGSRLIEPGIAAGTQYIGYSWPYEGTDVAKVIDKPVVVELFSTQGCMFCPVADHLFVDLMEKAPNVIGLSCHVDYIKIDPRNPQLSLEACTSRQNAYALNNSYSKTYTPQIVVNAKTQSYGFLYDSVLKNLTDAMKTPPVQLAITKEKGAQYTLTKPAGEFPDSQLEVVQYLKPQTPKVVGGQNDGIKMNYHRVVASISPVAEWPAAGASVPLTIKPGPDTAGAVVLLRDKTRGILGVGEVKF